MLERDELFKLLTERNIDVLERSVEHGNVPVLYLPNVDPSILVHRCHMMKSAMSYFSNIFEKVSKSWDFTLCVLKYPDVTLRELAVLLDVVDTLVNELNWLREKFEEMYNLLITTA